MDTTTPDHTPRRELSLLDSTSLIVGIIIGAGIYQMAPSIARGAGAWWGVLLIFALGGLLSLFGALGYAELATAYPRQGGDYVYLNRAYGRWAGFLFGWIQMCIVRPGDIVVMAFAFGMYGRLLYDPFPGSELLTKQLYAAAAVVVLTAVNVLGVKQGKWTQNLLTAVKVLGLLAIFCVALLGPAGQATAAPIDPMPIAVALVLVLFTFGGWNEMAYVAAEVREPQRNIVRALVLGTVSVTAIYLLANLAFLYALGYEGMAASGAVAADTVSALFPRRGAAMISALICVSALGAVNGLIFTGARISYAVGADHRVFSWLGRWNARTGTPAIALLVQGAIALVLILLLQGFVEAVLYTAPAVYLFYLATSAALIVLRRKEPQIERPYRVTLYPVPTIIFCAVCAFLIYSSVDYAWSALGKPWIVAVPFSVIPLGLLIFLLGQRLRSGPSA